MLQQSTPGLWRAGLCLPLQPQTSPLDPATSGHQGLGLAFALCFSCSGYGKDPTCQCRRHRDERSIPGSGRSPGGDHGNPPEYSCLENPMDRGTWEATVHRMAQTQTQWKRLGIHTGIIPSLPALLTQSISLVVSGRSFQLACQDNRVKSYFLSST